MNGAKGTSLLKDSLNLANFIFCKNNNIRLNAAPIQKASMIAYTPPEKPRRNPTPTASFASPKPIHFPPDMSQKNAKKAKSIGPASKSRDTGKIRISPTRCTRKNIPTERAMKVNTIPSGIILCLKS